MKPFNILYVLFASCNILYMLFAPCSILFVYAWRDSLLGIINSIDQYIEHNNIERVHQALWTTLLHFIELNLMLLCFMHYIENMNTALLDG